MPLTYRCEAPEINEIDWDSSVVVDGVLRLPLFHGTSSLWLDSIERNGLGGAWPPIQEAKALLGKILDRIPLSERDLGAEKMVLQEEGFTNWQHGQVYFSLAFGDAERYARSNALGSELLSECLHYAEEFDLVAMLPGWLKDLRGIPKMPVVLKVAEVQISWLERERRLEGTANDALAKLDEFRQKQHSNFEAIEAVREEIGRGVFDRIELALAHKGVSRMEYMRCSMLVFLLQNTFRLRRGFVIPAERIEVIELEGASLS